MPTRRLDLELRCKSTGQNLGRPWMTLLVDTYSRRILGLRLTFDPPSYRSCMMVIRDCVRRHSRLPQVLDVDGGREFDSVYFESLLARYELTKKTRPPAKARFGSVLDANRLAPQLSTDVSKSSALEINQNHAIGQGISLI